MKMDAGVTIALQESYAYTHDDDDDAEERGFVAPREHGEREDGACGNRADARSEAIESVYEVDDVRECDKIEHSDRIREDSEFDERAFDKRVLNIAEQKTRACHQACCDNLFDR